MKVSECDCVILCGGLGKRLQSVVHGVSKVMAEVDGRPFLDFILEFLKSQGVERVILCTGYKADSVEDYYRNKDFGLVVDFSREGEPLGTGGALKNARAIISSDSFVVLNGDSFLSFDLQSLLDFHQNKKAIASILVSEVDDNKDFGSLDVDKNQQVIRFREKEAGAAKGLVNAGIYCFNTGVFSLMPAAKKFSLENDVFPKLIGNHFYAYQTDQKFLDMGTPQRYELIKQKLKFKKTKN